MKSAQERILVRGVNWLGDAVMTTPALRRLREALPGAFIALLTPVKLADLWSHHPAIDAVLSFEKGESVFRIGRRLRTERFDIALILPNSPRSALECFAAGIPRRIGYARRWRKLLLSERVSPRSGTITMRKRSRGEILRAIRDRHAPHRTMVPASSHQTSEYLHLASQLGGSPDPLRPEIVILPEEVTAIRQRFGFAPALAGPPPLLGLNPGAEYGPAKRWPRERFVAAAVELQRRTGCGWWIFGATSDRELAQDIADRVQLANPAFPESVRCLAGQTSLRELCAGLKACDVVLTNDTGPMHVAAAVGTPVVVPFGSTSPELTGPGWPGDSRHVLIKSDAACSPCFRRECPIDFRCMLGIGVDAVVAAVLRAGGISPRAD
jgi:heptosyltransferase-2